MSARSKPAERRYFIGGSDARIIMGDDEASLIRLWQEKRGEVEPEDLSRNLTVQLGLVTEELNRRWYEANTGEVIADIQKQVRHPTVRWLAATLDGRIQSNGAVFESKFMLPWYFSEEAAVAKYMSQLQHNMWVVAARSAVLSVITGGGKWVEIKTHADPLHQHLIMTAERKFWRCVETGERPRLFGLEPPKPRIEAVRIVDMASSNAWAEFAGIFARTKTAHTEHEQAKTELKKLMPEDAQQAIGHGVRAKRSKSGTVSFDLLKVEDNHAAIPSECIASLAAALAKAQIELVNPEKSLIGTISSGDPKRAERAFRYASLSSGLDIVRKVLGQHEIATVQTTSVDQTAGIINLTTVLAHASGEWIASDWPVCAVSETATPHRMGAALTYARRYALFTLVGIAGEDDLDAPDLITPTTQTSMTGSAPGRNNGRLNGGQRFRAPGSRRDHQIHSNSAPPTLGAEASAELRDRLLAELNEVGSRDDAATWAHRRLSEKGKLLVDDARRVEDTFVARLAAFATDASEPAPTQQLAERTTKPQRLKTGAGGNRLGRKRRSEKIDKSLLAFPEPRRIRDRDHVRFVAKEPCLICGRLPSDAHHLRVAQSPALGRKVSDEFTVPLCRGHHRELHRCGDEPVWWLKVRINPMLKARELWLQTHPLLRDRDDRPAAE
jgi:hypothetical protein